MYTDRGRAWRSSDRSSRILAKMRTRRETGCNQDELSAWLFGHRSFRGGTNKTKNRVILRALLLRRAFEFGSSGFVHMQAQMKLGRNPAD